MGNWVSKNSSAREVILAKIRTANRGSSNAADARSEWSQIRRQYQQTARRPPAEILDLLVNRLEDYEARVVQSSYIGLRETIAQILTVRSALRMVIPPGFPTEVLPNGFSFAIDSGLSAVELDGIDGVLTESTVAIAETGTIVLQNVPGQGRPALTLVPDYHLCIVDVTKIVETVPEGMAMLQGTSELATTFISGPSATADIEMTRIKGVHGPRFMDVILIIDH
jgi:L-lactate dehydrogenase complex protein LldG